MSCWLLRSEPARRKKLANEVKKAKRRKLRLTKRARLLSTEDLLTVVALREAERAARDGASRGGGASDEPVASEHSEHEEELPNAAEGSGLAEPSLQDADEREQNPE